MKKLEVIGKSVQSVGQRLQTAWMQSFNKYTVVEDSGQCKIIAEVEVTYKPNVKPIDQPHIKNSQDVYKVIMAEWNKQTIDFFEQFKIVLINRANRVMGISTISSGSIAGTLVDPKIVFSAALKGCASSIILVHNHPSQNLKPSEADTSLTRKLLIAGEYLQINVLDHFIISSNGYLSFADEGLL